MPHRVLRLLLAFLHRARTSGPRVLGVLAVLVVVLGTWRIHHEGSALAPPFRWDEALYDAFGLFTMAGNRLGYPYDPVLRLVYFLAPAVSASAVFGAFVHLVAERAPLLVRRFAGHTVIGGLGNLGGTIARDQQKHRHPFIAIEREEDAPNVTDLRASGEGVVVVGDMTSPEVLRRARCQHAARVFFTSPRDVVNLDAAFTVRRLARERRRRLRAPPAIYAHVYDVALSDALLHQLRANAPGDAPIIPFNSYRFAAKALVSRLLRDRLLGSLRVAPGLAMVRTAWPDDGDPAGAPVEHGPGADLAHHGLREDLRRLHMAFRLAPEPEDAPRFAVVGLGRFGRSVVRELLDAGPPGARFLAVEQLGPALDSHAELFTPEERARIELHVGDAVVPSALAKLQACGPTAVLICTDNDLSNLRLALELRRRDVRVITRMFDLEANTELGRGLDERGVSPVGLSRLFRAAIPILTHERNLLACLNLDVLRTPVQDHLFYLARVSPEERERIGEACVPLSSLPTVPDAPAPPGDLALVWHRSIKHLSG